MKKIEILQTGVRPIVMFDDDQTSLTEYSKSISGLLKNGNVSILETSTGNIVLRPQHVYSIIIEDGDKSIKAKTIVPQKPEEQEDTITG